MSQGDPAETLGGILVDLLAPTEQVSMIAAAVGCSLVLTDRRLVLVRDGAHYRPRTGVQSWTLDRNLVLRIDQARTSGNRLMIERSGKFASVFVTADQIPLVRTLIADIRRRIYASK